jgi:hypothetical protein
MEEFAIKDSGNAMLNMLIEMQATQRVHIKIMQAMLTKLQGNFYSLSQMDLDVREEIKAIKKHLYENYGDIDTGKIGL